VLCAASQCQLFVRVLPSVQNGADWFQSDKQDLWIVQLQWIPHRRRGWNSGQFDGGAGTSLGQIWKITTCLLKKRVDVL